MTCRKNNELFCVRFKKKKKSTKNCKYFSAEERKRRKDF